MAKFFKIDSEIHKKFEKMFSQMEELGISMINYSGNNNVFDINHNGKNYAVKVVDAESYEGVYVYPPFAEYRIMLLEK